MMLSGDFMVPNESANCRVVCDAGPVIHLDELGCLNLLEDFKEVILTEAVWDEISLNRPAGWSKADFPVARQLNSLPVGEELNTLCRVFSLHWGEVSAWELWKRIPGHCSSRMIAPPAW